MSIADHLRSHAQVTPFYQVRTTYEPVYQAQGAADTRPPYRLAPPGALKGGKAPSAPSGKPPRYARHRYRKNNN